MASPNMSSASASASVGSAATNTTDIKAPLWDDVTNLEKPKTVEEMLCGAASTVQCKN